MHSKSLLYFSLPFLLCAICVVNSWSSVAQSQQDTIVRPVDYNFGCQIREKATKRPQIKYRVASDTVHVYGDGKFQVAKVYNGYGLFNSTSPLGIAMNVSTWAEKGKFGYVIGEEGFQPSGRTYRQKFFLIYLPTNRLTKYSRLSNVPAKHRQVFDYLRKSKRRTP